MRHRIRHYPSKNVCQYIKSLYCRMRHFSKFVTLRFFFNSQDWHDHRKIIAKLTIGSFRWPWRKKKPPSAALQKVLFRTASKAPRNTGSGTFMQELFRRKSLAQECKYTVLIFTPSVSELSGHGFYFFNHSLNNPASITDRYKTFLFLRYTNLPFSPSLTVYRAI